MAYPHAQCAHTHWHGAAQGIMRMHSPSYNYTHEQSTNHILLSLCMLV